MHPPYGLDWLNPTFAGNCSTAWATSCLLHLYSISNLICVCCDSLEEFFKWYESQLCAVQRVTKVICVLLVTCLVITDGTSVEFWHVYYFISEEARIHDWIDIKVIESSICRSIFNQKYIFFNRSSLVLLPELQWRWKNIKTLIFLTLFLVHITCFVWFT